MRCWLVIMMLIGFVLQPGLIRAEDFRSAIIVIKDHRFSPEVLKVSAHRKFKLTIDNQDSTNEEFESFDLNREKLVPGNSQVTVYLGPLNPGKYSYFGDFHQKTARAVITAE